MVLTRFRRAVGGGGVFNLSTSSYPLHPQQARKPGRPGLDLVGREGWDWLSSHGAVNSPPTQWQNSRWRVIQQWRRDLLYFAFEVNSLPFPSTSSVPSLSATNLASWKGDANGKSAASERARERERERWRWGEWWGRMPGGLRGTSEEWEERREQKSQREREREVDDYIARKQQPPFILLHYHTN